VWHAFWTFACQFSLLADVGTQSPAILLEEPGLLDFAAAMPPRVECCFDSLKQFSIVAPPELIRCSHAMYQVRAATDRLATLPRFAATLQEEADKTDNDYQRWAELILGRQEGG